jgi:hypothetical protein
VFGLVSATKAFRGSGVDIRQLSERLVEGEQVGGAFVGLVGGNLVEVERCAGSASTVLDSMLATSVLDQNPAHRLGSGGEEVAAAVPWLVGLGPDDAQVSFVNKRCGLERLPEILPSQAPLGELSQLVVDQRKQVTSCLCFTAIDRVQDSSDFDTVGLDGCRPFLVIAGLSSGPTISTIPRMTPPAQASKVDRLDISIITSPA